MIVRLSRSLVFSVTDKTRRRNFPHLCWCLCFFCSFIARVLLLFAALEVRCSSYVMQSSPQQDLADTRLLPNCNRLDVRQNCIRGSLFRTFDGTCNNLCNITNGAAGSSFLRLDRLDPPNTFQQPGNLPRVKSVTGGFLRNARNISRIVFKNTDANVNNTAPNFTHVTMTWGQFLDHDLTLTRLVPGIECGVNNAPCEDKKGCTNIDILEGDELLNNKSARCIPLRRAKQNNQGEQVSFETTNCYVCMYTHIACMYTCYVCMHSMYTIK